MKTIGRLIVPSMLAMALAAGLSVTASASPDDRYGNGASYASKSRTVKTNFTSSRGGGSGGMNTRSGYRDRDDRYGDGRHDDRDDHDDRNDDHDDRDDHDGGFGGGMGSDHDGGGMGGDHGGGDDGGHGGGDDD